MRAKVASNETMLVRFRKHEISLLFLVIGLAAGFSSARFSRGRTMYRQRIGDA
jgi:hypothetical protein